MGLFRRMAVKALALTLPEPLRRLVLEQMAAVPSGSYKEYVQSGLRGNPYVARSVKWIAQNGGRVALRPYTRTSDEDRTPLPWNHPLALTLRRPNPLAGQARFQERVLMHLCMAGDAYILGVSSAVRDGRMELYTRRPDWMKPVRARGADLTGYTYRPDGSGVPTNYTLDEICHTFLPDPLDDLDGMSLAEPAWRSILQSNAAGVWNYNLLHKGARPSLAWETRADEPMTKEQFDEVERRINEKYGGADNAGKPIVADGFTVKPIGLSPAEAEWYQGVVTTMREIAMAFGVPSVLLGDVENATYSNMQTAIRLLYELTIFPLLDILCDDLTTWLGDRYGQNVVIGYETKNIAVLQETAAEKWQRIDAAKWLTINQKLAESGYPDIGKPGDVYLLSPADMPVTADGLLEMATAAADVVTAEEDEPEPPAEADDENDEEGA